MVQIDFDLVYTFDENVTVTSATATVDNTISNKVNVVVQCLGPTDMASDATMKLQYYSGSGTNKITFRGRIPSIPQLQVVTLQTFLVHTQWEQMVLLQ